MPEGIVHGSLSNAIGHRPHEGRAARSPRRRIVVVTGASGAGKTTTVRALEARSLPGVACFYFDSIGVPSAPEMERTFGGGERWQAHATAEWLARLDADPGDNSVAVFAIDQETGEPTLVQTIDGRGIQLRTFGIDPSGKLLVAASIMPLPVRGGDKVFTLPAGIMVFRIGDDGRLTFARKYDVDTGSRLQFWSGMVTLA